MKMSRSQSQKPPKRHKNRLTEDQLRLLEASFSHEKKLGPERKLQLSYQLGMPEKQVAIWYQNKRARWKTQNIKVDNRAFQQRLDSILVEKAKLQREVGRLRIELQKAHEMLMSLNLTGAPPTSSISTSYEDCGSSNLSGDVSYHWQKNTEGLQVDDLYACLIGSGDHTAILNRNSLFSPWEVPGNN